MRLTDQQLKQTGDSIAAMTDGFRNGHLARSYSEYKRGGKKLLWAGPRIVRNCKMLVDEIKRLRQEREQMVEALKFYANEENNKDHFSEDDPFEFKWSKVKLDNGKTAADLLKQVGELDD